MPPIIISEPNEVVEKGERIGLIHFGSRVDLAFESSGIKIKVKEGDRILAGQTMAEFTPMSSADDYEKRFEKGEEPRKLDKEYVRTWLAEKGFTGDGKPPKLTDKLRVEAAARYMEVVESFTEEPMQLEVGPVDESIYSILNPFAY